MDVRERAAAIATVLNVALTVFKFALYALTGSLAILAEAWHSLSDIATSAMTFAAVRRAAREPDIGCCTPTEDVASPHPLPPGAEEEEPSDNPRSWALPSAEPAASLTIALVIFAGAVSIAARVVWYEPLPIARPLLGGVLFFVFALGSYLVYRMEVDVGQKTGSPGLIADGLHSRADMVASLLTGTSLVLYHLGLDLDRLIAALIGIVVLSIALEAGVNAVAGWRRGREAALTRYRTHEILAKVLDAEWLEQQASRMLGPEVLSSVALERFRNVRRWGTATVAIVVLLVYGRTCLFSVDLTQEAIVEHWGRPIRRAVQPGLHLKWPWPIDQIVLVDKPVVVATHIGNETDPQAFALIWTREHGTEIPFLSGDNNFFYPYLIVHWRVKDTFKVAYRQQESRDLLDAVCHRVVSELCAARGFYELASTYRGKLAEDVRAATQARLDDLDSGLEIVSVNLSDIHPPVFIADSFEEVVVARFQEIQQMINEATGSKNERLPRAVGEAAKQVARASADRADQVGRAIGRAQGFTLRCEALSAGRNLLKERMYFDYLVDSLRSAKKVLIEAGLGRPDLWMGFDGPAGTSLSPPSNRAAAEVERAGGMMRKGVVFLVVALGGWVIANTVFTVSEREHGIVTRFGRLTQTVTEPGLHFKWGSLLDRVTRIDKRLAVFQTRPIELLLGDQNPIILTSYVCWQVTDPVTFYRSLLSVENAHIKLGDMVQSSLGSVLSRYQLQDVINVDPNSVKLRQIELETQEDFAARAGDKYGIRVRDLGIRRIAYPPLVTQAVHNRMRSEREKEAKKYRGQGREAAAKIEGETDKQVADILAEAYRQSETIRGQGDADASQIYAEAYSKDADFFNFLASLEACKEILSQQATVILSTNSKLFRHLVPKEPVMEPAGAFPSSTPSSHRTPGHDSREP